MISRALPLARVVVLALAMVACGPKTVTVLIPIPSVGQAAVTVVDQSGWLRGATVPVSVPLVDSPTSTFVMNPGGNLHVLRLEWAARRCLSRATIEIRAGSPLAIDVTSFELAIGRQGCNEDVARRYAVDLEFDRAVLAAQVEVRDITTRPTPGD